jgi:polyisoprenoid-binding protein YceI
MSTTQPTTTTDLAPGLTAGTWAIDPAHSEVAFTVRHLMTKVRGVFQEFEGAIVVSEQPEISNVNVTIQTNSVNTRNEQRDNHLRSSDFFGIEAHPALVFSSTGVRVTGAETFVVTGDLTIKGVTKAVELEAEFLGVDTDAYGATRAGFEAGTTINRKDWGVDSNVPLGGDKMLIGDQVAIQLSVQAVRQDA